jgi:hypothetical protein
VTCSYNHHYNGKETMRYLRIVEPHNSDNINIMNVPQKRIYGELMSPAAIKLTYRFACSASYFCPILTKFGFLNISMLSPQHHFSRKSVQWESRWNIPTDGRAGSSQALFELCKRILRKRKASST